MTRFLAALALVLTLPVAPAHASRCDDLGASPDAERICDRLTDPPLVACRRIPPDDRLICV